MQGRKSVCLVGLLLGVVYAVVSWNAVVSGLRMTEFGEQWFWVQTAIVSGCFRLTPAIVFGLATLGPERLSRVIVGFGAAAWTLIVGIAVYTYHFVPPAVGPGGAGVPRPLFIIVNAIPSSPAEVGPFTIVVYLAMLIVALVPLTTTDPQPPRQSAPHAGR